MLAEGKEIGSYVACLDERLHSKTHNFEQRCCKILDRQQDTASSCNDERANNSKKRSAGTQLRLRLRCSQVTKRAKLDYDKNCGVAQLLVNCTEIHEQISNESGGH